MRALQQQPMPLTTGSTFNRRDIEQNQGSRLCTNGQGFTGAWPDPPQSQTIAGFSPLCSHHTATWLLIVLIS